MRRIVLVALSTLTVLVLLLGYRTSLAGRVDEQTLAEVGQLIARRQYLFTQLRFLSGTRPAWNT